MGGYRSIDSTLLNWAVKNDLVWLTAYQDAEVRTIYLNADSRSRVQIWVDPPVLGFAVVNVWQLPRGISRLARRRRFIGATALLRGNLDKAFKLARDWAASEPAPALAD